jgi:PKD repeat protein
MLLLTLIAVDFGRIYLGWINLQSAARAASNFAANNSEAWLENDAATIAEYRNQVLNDTTATNCVLTPDVPADPTFEDGTGDGTTTQIGDRAIVAFTCTFTPITPIISSIVGSGVSVSASAMFPVKTGQFSTGGGTGSGLTADFTGSPTTTTVGSNVIFTDASTGSPTTWNWDFGDGGTSTAQNPIHAYTAPGTYTVILTVTNSGDVDTRTRTSYITVGSPGPVADFTASTTTPTTGQAVTFTDTSTGNPTAWAWTFGDGGSINTGPVVSHAYNTAGTYTVTLTVTSSSGTNTVTKTNYIVVSTPTCLVPEFFGTSSSSAQATWDARGFTTAVRFKQGGLPWTIQSQDVVANTNVPCSTVITVSKN